MTDKLIVIAIPGIDRAVLDDQVRRGNVPTIAGLIRGGELTELVSLADPASLAAWASLVTGVPSNLHQFTTSFVAGPAGTQPAGYADWAVRPVWERLAGAGIRTGSICWPGTYPGGAWQGVHVDPRYCAISGLTHDDWPLPLDVAPSDYRLDLRDRRVHPNDLSPQVLLPLLSNERTIPGSLADRLKVEISRISTLQSGVDLLLANDVDCVFIYNDWIETASSVLSLHPSLLPDAAWYLLDHSVAGMVISAGAQARLMIVSLGNTEQGFLLTNDERTPLASLATLSSLTFANIVYACFGFTDPGIASGPRTVTGALAQLPDPKLQRSEEPPSENDVARLASFGFEPTRPDPNIVIVDTLARARAMLEADPGEALLLVRTLADAGHRSVEALGIEAAAQVSLGHEAELPAIAARIEALSPDHPWQHLALAAYHALKKDVTNARPHLKLVESAGTSDDWARAGTIWLMLNRKVDAARLFRGVLLKMPWHMGALLGLLTTDTVQGLEAEKLLRRVLTLDPNHAVARSSLNELLRSIGRSREAMLGPSES